MILKPRYEGPTILSINGEAGDQLEPLKRQRRRMQAMLATLTDEQWVAPSRCVEWTVREVVAHLVGVNSFWRASVAAGLAGAPTRILGGGFDPATTPPLMVSQMSTVSTDALLEQFVATNEALIDAVSDLTDDGWSTVAESPPGHVSIRLLAQHALWDCWVHERDIAVPLGISTACEADELRSCLQYAAAVSPALGIGLGHDSSGSYAVEATDPPLRFVLDVGESIALRDGASAAPCLRGNAVELIEALSLRAPMPRSTPDEWTQLVAGLATAFDAV